MGISNRLTNLQLSTSRGGSFWTSRTPSRRSTQPITSELFMLPVDLRRSPTSPILSHNLPSESGYFPQKVSAYNLCWPKLRGWLITHFSDEPTLATTLFEKQEGITDVFYFYIPRQLTKEEVALIDKLRDKNDENTDRSKHRAYTPDPDPDRDDDPV